MDSPARHRVELTTCTPDDPDGRRAASLLAAYFNVEQAHAFRRLLWRQAAAILAITSILRATTSWLSRGVFSLALISLGAAVVAAAIGEHRAERSLRALL